MPRRVADSAAGHCRSTSTFNSWRRGGPGGAERGQTEQGLGQLQTQWRAPAVQRAPAHAVGRHRQSPQALHSSCPPSPLRSRYPRRGRGGERTARRLPPLMDTTRTADEYQTCRRGRASASHSHQPPAASPALPPKPHCALRGCLQRYHACSFAATTHSFKAARFHD
jgi:hypothetical protein